MGMVDEKISIMETLLIITGVILLAVAVAGCVIPGLPGPPLGYLALILQEFRDPLPFSFKFMMIWLLVTVIVTLLDYLIPGAGVKKLGGSRYGMIGALAGVLLGLLLFPPFGIIIGPLAGALAGELIAGRKMHVAFKAALGSVAGVLAGIVLKLITVFMMIWYFASAL